MPLTRPTKTSKASPIDSSTSIHKSTSSFPTPSLTDQNVRMSYEIARGEQGVLTFEPYKSILLPYWRFRTVPIAGESSKTLKGAFKHYVAEGDFVGADMARKFIQMGMTRAKRYANHKGGRKYEKSELELERAGQKGAKRTQLPKSTGHADQDEKLAASEIFKEIWRECINDEAYLKLKGEWQKEKKAWTKAGGVTVKKEGANAEYDREVKVEPKREEHVEEMKIKVEKGDSEGEEEKKDG